MARVAIGLAVMSGSACGTIDHQIDYWDSPAGSTSEPRCQVLGGVRKDMAWISGLLDRQASFDAEWLLLAPAAVIDLPCSLVLDLGMLPLTVSEQVWVWFRPAPSCSCSQDPGVPTSHQGHELESQSGHAFR